MNKLTAWGYYLTFFAFGTGMFAVSPVPEELIQKQRNYRNKILHPWKWHTILF